MESKVIVEGVHVHAASGHITVRVKTVTTDGQSTRTGPVRGYGVDAVGFVKRFNSDKTQLLNWIKSQHQAYDGADVTLATELMKLKGQAI